MPMIDVKLPTGALSAGARAELSDHLATTLLKWEKAPVNDLTRSITWVTYDEREFHLPDGLDRFHVLVTVPEGALSERRKEGLIAEATELVLQAAGIEGREFVDTARVWVHIHEVPEGHWGAAGQVFRYKDIVAAVNPQPVATAAG